MGVQVCAVASVGEVLRQVSVDGLSDADVRALLARPRIDFSSILDTVC